MTHPERHIRRLTGTLDNDTYDLFARVAFGEIDYVVGLDFFVTPTRDRESELNQMVAAYHDGYLTVYKVQHESGSEIIISGGLWPYMGMLRVNGFYMVKGKGMLQGISRLGLIQTDEAVIRLNPAVRMVNIELAAVEDTL